MQQCYKRVNIIVVMFLKRTLKNQ